MNSRFGGLPVRLRRLEIGAFAFCMLAGVASAASFSFSGTFTQDDQRQLFLFTAPSSDVVMRTWSYAGGNDAAGDAIAPGGFNPVLSLFDATGGLTASSALVDSNDDGTGVVAADPATLNAYDSLLELTTLLAGHTYALVLTENDNFANGLTYGDGFSEDGNGNFTAANGCGGNPFCEGPGAQRNGSWAVDITGVGSAQATGVPEPAAFLLGSLGLCAFVLARRRG